MSSNNEHPDGCRQMATSQSSLLDIQQQWAILHQSLSSQRLSKWSVQNAEYSGTAGALNSPHLGTTLAGCQEVGVASEVGR